MELRTPLSRVLGSGSAKDGTDHWWQQRLSAIGVLLLGSWFAWCVATLPVYDFAHVSAWIGTSWNSVLLSLLCLTLGWHSMLGIQVIVEDYVHGPLLKVVALIINKFAHVVLVLAAIFAVLRIAVGAPA